MAKQNEPADHSAIGKLHRSLNTHSTWYSSWHSAPWHQKAQYAVLLLVIVTISSAVLYRANTTDEERALRGVGAEAAYRQKANAKFRLAPKRVKGNTAKKSEYVVVLADNMVGSANKAAAIGQKAGTLQKTYGGRNLAVFGAALNGYVIEASEAQAKKLSTDPAIKYVEEAGAIKPAASQANPPKGLDRLDQKNLPLNNRYDYDNSGEGVTVHVLDTGIRTTHQDLGGRASTAADYVGDGLNGADCFYSDGHGTPIAGIIAGSTHGVAKSAQIRNHRIMNCQGSGSTTNMIAAINAVMASKQGPTVINFSIELPGTFQSVETAIRNAYNAGIVFVAAAGNSNKDNCGNTPQRMSEVITVGATGWDDRPVLGSNYGSCVIMAPGDYTRTISAAGDTSVVDLGGTSFSTAHVSGLAALLLAKNPSSSPSQIKSAILSTATSGVLQGLPSGTPNLLAFSNPSTAQAPSCTSANPTLTVTPAVGEAFAGQSVSYTFTLKNNDGAGCAGSTYNVTANNLPANWTMSPNSFTENLNPGAQVSRSFSIASTSGAVPNNYSINLKATKSTNPAISGQTTFNHKISGSASVQGNVYTPAGTAFRDAVVTLRDSSGTTMTTRSSTTGFYQFNNVPLGSYQISVFSKRYRFEPKLLNITGNVSNYNFVGLE